MLPRSTAIVFYISLLAPSLPVAMLASSGEAQELLRTEARQNQSEPRFGDFFISLLDTSTLGGLEGNASTVNLSDITVAISVIYVLFLLVYISIPIFHLFKHPGYYEYREEVGLYDYELGFGYGVPHSHSRSFREGSMNADEDDVDSADEDDVEIVDETYTEEIDKQEVYDRVRRFVLRVDILESSKSLRFFRTSTV